MDSQSSHAKRTHYQPQQYAQLLDQLTRLIEEVPKLRPDRDKWDIEGDWAATGTIFFVDSLFQDRFVPLQDFDCRTIKLVNLHQPAARITFYRKHRYWLLKDKDLPILEKINQIQAFLQELDTKQQALQEKMLKLAATRRLEAQAQLDQYQQQIQQWQTILDEPGRYELAISNYSRNHFYVTVNYKYRLPTGEYANAQEHLLNAQRDRQGNITQPRYNVLFVDTHEILREHPYQNREVEAYLQNFSIQSELGRHTLYARPRPQPSQVDNASYPDRAQ